MASSKTADKPPPAAAMLDGFAEAMAENRSHAMSLWSEHCALLSRYFDALANARGADGLASANLDLMSAELDLFSRAASSVRLPLSTGGDAKP